MSGLHRSAKKALPKEGLHSRAARKVNEEAEKAYSSMTPKMPQQEEEPAIPLPDEEELARIRRRKAAGRSGGRSSTVLTEERFGP